MNNVSNQGKINPAVIKNVMRQHFIKINELYKNYDEKNKSLNKTISLMKKVEEIVKMFPLLNSNNRKNIMKLRKKLESNLNELMFSDKPARALHYTDHANFYHYHRRLYTNNNLIEIKNLNFHNQKIDISNNKINYDSMNPGDFIVFPGGKLYYINPEHILKRAYNPKPDRDGEYHLDIPEGYSKFTTSIVKKLQNILPEYHLMPRLFKTGRISVRGDDRLIKFLFRSLFRLFRKTTGIKQLPSKYKYFLEPDKKKIGLKNNNELKPVPFMFTIRNGNSLNAKKIMQIPIVLIREYDGYSFRLVDEVEFYQSKNFNKLKELTKVKVM